MLNQVRSAIWETRLRATTSRGLLAREPCTLQPNVSLIQRVVLPRWSIPWRGPRFRYSGVVGCRSWRQATNVNHAFTLIRSIISQLVMLRMTGHGAQVACLSWFAHLLSSGSGDGSIWHHDVRVARHKVMELNGHSGEVCGLKWREDGELLASGGNDNVVNIWDGRVGDAVTNSMGRSLFTVCTAVKLMTKLYHRRTDSGNS
jgi:hypothetical protein